MLTKAGWCGTCVCVHIFCFPLHFGFRYLKAVLRNRHAVNYLVGFIIIVCFVPFFSSSHLPRIKTVFNLCVFISLDFRSLHSAVTVGATSIALSCINNRMSTWDLSRLFYVYGHLHLAVPNFFALLLLCVSFVTRRVKYHCAIREPLDAMLTWHLQRFFF